MLGRFILFVAAGGCLFAQVSGRMAGNVVDETGAPVRQATVQLFLPGGSLPVATTLSATDGRYQFTAIRPEFYDLTVDATGFARSTVRALKVDPALETLVVPILMRPGQFGVAPAATPQTTGTAAQPAASVLVVEEQFRLGLGSTAAPLEISDQQQGPRTESVEVATTLTREQVRTLPAIERDPLALLRTQAGINRIGVDGPDGGFVTTVVNGQRASYANMTLDGINIQPNLFRDNALSSEFNRFYLDQVSEFTVITSNAASPQPIGASQVIFVTPSGTNLVHGSLYWYNRNKAFTANNWLDNSRGFDQLSFAQNQFGASFQGPVRKDKFLLYGNYEGFRRRQQTPETRTLPHDTIRQGLFRYIDTSGNLRQIDLPRAIGFPIHPEIGAMLGALPAASNINTPFLAGDSLPGVPVNTGGYTFPVRRNLDRNSVLVKPDWIVNPRHAFSASFTWALDERDEPFYYTEGYSNIPTASQDRRWFGSAAWRWNPTAQFTNELRGGVHLQNSQLLSNDTFGSRLLNLPQVTSALSSRLFTNPVNPFQGEETDDNIHSLQNNANWTAGRHSLQFGVQYQRLSSDRFDLEARLPEYSLGFTSGVVPDSLLPGADARDRAAANAWASTLIGLVSNASASYYTNSRDSGYVNGVPYVRRLAFPQWSGYLFDVWRATPRLTLTMGLRYDWFGVVTERDSQAFSANLVNNDPVATLLSDMTFDFAGSASGRPWYPRDNNNFAPQLGLAWDIGGNRRTVLRAGYSLHYVNDEHIRATSATLEFNPGLIQNLTNSYFTEARFLNEDLAPAAPSFSAPARLSQFTPTESLSGVGIIDPNLRTPYVQQWNASLQREIAGMLIDIRYLGSRAVKGFRAVDYNQVDLGAGGYIQDFQRALDNGRLATGALGRFDPAYNPAINGSQPLPYFARLPNNGSLSNPLVQSMISRGDAAELAVIYQSIGFAPESFYRNPLALGGAFLMANRTTSTFHGFQAEVQRRLRNGLQFQANYALGKVLSDSRDIGTTRFEAYLDSANPTLERSRASFDVRHVIKGNFLYELPFARLARNTLSRRLLEGWGLSGIAIVRSGTPFSINSGRATINVSGEYSGLPNRSANNTAVTLLNGDQLKDLIYLRFDGFGPKVVPDSILAPDGRGAVDPGERPFQGQVFFNPEPGTVGSMQRRYFSGPWVSSLDASVFKSTRVFENHSIEFRFEARNVLNSANWTVRSQDINSIAFGYSVSIVGDSERQMQAGLYYRF